MTRLPRFESTIWTVIRLAKQKDKQATESFVLKYRSPILNYIKLNGFSDQDADDLTQEVFLKIFKDNILERADKEKGRLRNYLLAITRDIIKKLQRKATTQKRGGGLTTILIDEDFDLIQKDEKFDRLWMQNILDIALHRLKAEAEQTGSLYHKIIESYLDSEGDHEKIAKETKLQTKDVRNYLHRAKLKLMEYIRQEIATYSSSEEEYDEEVDYLPGFIQ